MVRRVEMNHGSPWRKGVPREPFHWLAFSALVLLWVVALGLGTRLLLSYEHEMAAPADVPALWGGSGLG